MKGLWQSRKFWTLLLDTVVSIAVYFVAALVAPRYAEYSLFLIGALQPVVLAVIAGWAWEDAAAKRAGTFIVRD